MRFTGINHVVLTCDSLSGEYEFYRNLFGTDNLDYQYIKTKQAGSFSLKNVGLMVWFHQFGPPRKERFDEKRIGLDHLAWGVKEEELEYWLKRIKVAGGKTVGIEVCEFTGKKYICFRDPENFQIEIYCD